ncbi:hypothetical protein HRbin11_01461 [bacterium HR11]|nr:hypothetical protein HRbin11_01461 [bacterium HR11]
MDRGYSPDVLQDLVPFWLQQSVGALAQLVGRPLRWQVDHSRRVAVPTDFAGSAEQVVVYVQEHESDFRLWAVGWPVPTAVQLLRWLRVSDDGPPSASAAGSLAWVLDRPARVSALLEAGNVMAGTFFTAVAGFMNRVLIPSPPDLFVGDAATCQTYLRDLVVPGAGTWFTMTGRLVGEGLELPQWMAVFITGREVGR